MRNPVPTVDVEFEAARSQLERVLSSSGFVRNERLSRFLRFLVEQHLEGKDEELKESVIGVEIFGRAPDYNPKRDAIVRTEASRLRTRLNEYYVDASKDDPLVIELPKGGYVPVIRPSQRSPEITTPLTIVHSEPPLRRCRHGTTVWIGAVLAGLVVVTAAATGWRFSHPKAPIPIAV